MTHIAFFGHDAGDAAIRRRARAFLADGFEVTGFMMRRGPVQTCEWTSIDLGETRDGAFARRIGSVLSGARQASADPRLAEADLIYARNLDMLICAVRARRQRGLDTPIVYECLDVHRLLVRSDPIGWGMRQVEQRLLKASAALVVSSPAFLREHFEPRYGSPVPTYLVENRMAAGTEFGARPAHQPAGGLSGGDPIRIGWFGILRCSRSLDLLLGLADQLGEGVDLNFRGRVSAREIPDFEARIGNRRNVSFGGAFKAPEDLASIYGSVDVVWAGDFMEAGFNSVWLLPNRLYEGGYYAVPPIAPAGTETARWIMDHGCGFEVAEPLHETLPALVERLRKDPDVVLQKRTKLLDLPDSVFIQPAGAMKTLIDDILSRQGL